MENEITLDFSEDFAKENSRSTTYKSTVDAPSGKDEKENLAQRFDREKKEWCNKLEQMTVNMRDIGQCALVLTDALSNRQIALEYSHVLMGSLSKINADLRDKKKEKYIFYSQSYDLKLDKEPKNMFIESDLRKLIMIQEALNGHLVYMRGTIDTIDKLIWGIKWTMDLQQYKRSQH